MGRLRQSELDTITDSIGMKKNRREKSVIAECPPTSRKTISKDRSNLCGNNIRDTKSSRILVQDSTSKGKDFVPYWNPQLEEISKRLWYPTETDCVDLDSNYLSDISRTAVENSWFSMKTMILQNQNSQETCSPYSMSSLVECTDSVDTLRRSRKIRIYPNVEQRKKLESWFGAARFYYNKTVEHFKNNKFKGRFAIQKDILKDIPEWAVGVPYKAKQMAIEDCCNATKNAIRKFKSSGKPSDIHFRSRKQRRDSVYIPKQAVYEEGIYSKLLGALHLTEEIKDCKYDCRLIKDGWRYYLIVPMDVQKKLPENQRISFVALDPGVRTFQSFYSSCMAGKIGEKDFGRIHRLCHYLDNMISEISKSKGQRKLRLRKANFRLRSKIKDLITELHNKVALFLVKNFDCVAIPTFETSQMVPTLHSKTARAMLSFRHYGFQQKLLQKAEEWNCKIIIGNEAYTSKTCSLCGDINSIGGKEEWTCKSCGSKHDRDINGSRGYYLRELGDHPWLLNIIDIPQSASENRPVKVC